MNTYNIESLLIGKEYYSATNRLHYGEIVSAEPRPSVSDNAWLISYRSPHSIKEQYATIEVYA